MTDKKLSEKLAADGVTLTGIELTAEGPDSNGWERRAYTLTASFEGRTLVQEAEYGTGAGEPTILDLMGPLIRQAATAEGAKSYEDWASDFTSDPDEYMPRDEYEESVQLAKRLRALLGDDRFEDYAYNTEHDD
ncbi:hypothetical protein ABT282_07150 [Streptomyces sp. NPDC000927]|uniref:hypothetical protein n=1 Tax=Streptomyces sp. NPDC000927 TaxID=3154371 RepID=UPI00332860B3